MVLSQGTAYVSTTQPFANPAEVSVHLHNCQPGPRPAAPHYSLSWEACLFLFSPLPVISMQQPKRPVKAQPAQMTSPASIVPWLPSSRGAEDSELVLFLKMFFDHRLSDQLCSKVAMLPSFCCLSLHQPSPLPSLLHLSL